MNNKRQKTYHHYSFYLALIVLSVISTASSCDEDVQTKTKLNYNGIASVFNDNKEATKYTITIYADQPGTGGDRDPYEMNGYTDVDVGHSFIKLERHNADGTKTTVTIGFYPAGDGASPTSPEDVGGIFDDTGHASDSSKEYEVTEEKFKDGLTYIETTENSEKKYNLNTYNCTDFVIETANAAGLNIPRTVGTWGAGPYGGSGANPGDLGEDIR